MYDDASLAKKTASDATSSGRPNRFSRVRATTAWRSVWACSGDSEESQLVTSAVSMGPGTMQLTRMSSGARSLACARVSDTTAPLEEQ